MVFSALQEGGFVRSRFPFPDLFGSLISSKVEIVVNIH